MPPLPTPRMPPRPAASADDRAARRALRSATAVPGLSPPAAFTATLVASAALLALPGTAARAASTPEPADAAATTAPTAATATTAMPTAPTRAAPRATSTPPPADQPTLPLWEAGVAGLGVSQQAYPGSDQQLRRVLVLPYAFYRGRVLRADRETAGLRALRTERLELDLGVGASFGGGTDAIEARQGMRALGTLLEAGPRLKWRLGEDPARSAWRLELPLRGVFDLSDGARHRGLAFEPELVHEHSRAGWRWKTALSAIVGDRRLAAHFYQVDAAEATAERAAHRARGGLIAWRAALSASHALGPDWRLLGFTRLDSVQGAANADSPLVRRKSGATVGLGLFWTGLRATTPAQD